MDWAIALGIIVVCATSARIIQKYALKRMQRFADRTESGLDDFLVRLVQKSVMPIAYALAVYGGIRHLQLPGRFSRVLDVAILVLVVFYAVTVISGAFSYFFMQYASRGEHAGQQEKQAKGILLLIKIVLWIVGLIFLVDNLGYDITTIVTGLGIGGIAIALAAQTILGDLFSYLVIFFDKPFETGDFIVVGDKSGVVENVGIKTTRLRTLSGEQLVVANTDLTNSRVQNFKRMEKRRVVFSLGVIYETGAKRMRKIPQMLEAIISGRDGVQFDRAHFAGFGDFSLNFEVVFYILSGDYTQYMDCQQDIYFDILEKFEEEGLEFAYPTQKLFMAATPANEKTA
ncbi:mechanosensitive ion channel family protein [Chitinophaga rhizosphaerae]|uniref:mechanosensitive ion channel family protein n=1 Tax=Chitinophaga rhizosphaerae TaxID=1864947 RepID=UPI001F0BC958|nr:mechanosensitive ion channel family protein [Chitinophaga rhizosphaerae]